MQTVRNGIFAELEAFSPEELAKKLNEKDVDHVEVFTATEENILTRQSLFGTKYTPSKGFQKAPKMFLESKRTKKK